MGVIGGFPIGGGRIAEGFGTEFLCNDLQGGGTLEGGQLSMVLTADNLEGAGTLNIGTWPLTARSLQGAGTNDYATGFVLTALGDDLQGSGTLSKNYLTLGLDVDDLVGSGVMDGAAHVLSARYLTTAGTLEASSFTMAADDLTGSGTLDGTVTVFTALALQGSGSMDGSSVVWTAKTLVGQGELYPGY